MTARNPWLSSSAFVFALHLAVLAALLADWSHTVQASLRDEQGQAMGLGVLMGSLVAPQERLQPAPRPTPRPAVTEQAPPPPAPPAPNAVTDERLLAPEPVAAAHVAAPNTTSASEAPAEMSTAPSAQAGGLDKGATSSYFGKLKAWLYQHKKYPVSAKKQRQQGTVTVTFSIDRGGRLQTARITESSGHPLLDKAALDLLRTASPMPRIPDSMAQENLVITLPIEYTLITQ